MPQTDPVSESEIDVYTCYLMWERYNLEPRQDFWLFLGWLSPAEEAVCTLLLELPQVFWLASEPQGADSRASVQGAVPQFKAWQPRCLLALKACFLSPRPEATVAARTGSQTRGQAELPARSWWAVAMMEWDGGALEPCGFWA